MTIDYLAFEAKSLAPPSMVLAGSLWCRCYLTNARAYLPSLKTIHQKQFIYGTLLALVGSLNYDGSTRFMQLPVSSESCSQRNVCSIP
ncbi:hypothetical protein ASPBRDRAFT_329864 [Aspergillus brasiliensis CBS 101740]|uniref:PLD phosphodiesterase domain-containing protein n=1 Tax=Aspergillus brasiliensis (strain CBS 101740 / IMI 381727 / IBT 21946) TaxID=767769 RepID=A0A1L9U8I5_ASPBC|nr:hypothetical protein ASPBRDRAFT_329864 [Aspergillus brasiliensis CBS 101740]